MLFNSWRFALFLITTFTLYWAFPHRIRWIILVISGLIFYVSWSSLYVLLLIAITVISYGAALAVVRERERERRTHAIFVAGIILCLLPLTVFKYSNFMIESGASFLEVFGVTAKPRLLKLVLPLGISFFSFQAVSYIVDVYKGKISAEKHLGIYSAFMMFFPQLLSGPIPRAASLLPQIKEKRDFSDRQATDGLRIVLWGFFKKFVIADNLAVYVDKVYDNLHSYSGFVLMLVAVFYSIQIYCDFSGYTDIASGVAKLLGIDLPDNFRSPYLSTTVKEFWSRWHISLSTWFRDYVYIPLGGNRCKEARHSFNLLLTFLISGLWHGADWSFVLWGGIHGVAQVAENKLKIKKRNSRDGIWVLRVLLLFIFTTVAWTFFRADSVKDAWYVITSCFSGITNPVLYFHKGFSDVGMSLIQRAILLVVMILPLTVYDYISVKNNKDAAYVITSWNFAVRWLFYLALGLAIVFLTPKGIATEFVYFQF